MAITRLGGANAITGTIPTSVAPGQGKVLQVVSATKTDTQSTSTATFVDVSGLSLSITPSSTSNKIFLVLNINIDGSERYMGVKFVRGSTDIGIGDADGSRARLTISSMRNHSADGDGYVMHNSSASFLDSPNTTSATTYKIQAGLHYGNAQSLYINRPHEDHAGSYIARGISTLTAYEIAG
jgi:hypothetical protein